MAAFRWAWRAFPWRWGNSRAVLDRALNDEKLMQLSLKQCNTRCISKYLWPMSIFIYIYLNKYNTYILSGCWYFLTCVLMITWLLFLCLEATSIAGGDFAGVIFCRFRLESFMGNFLESKMYVDLTFYMLKHNWKWRFNGLFSKFLVATVFFLKVVISEASFMLEFTVNNVSVDTRCI